ncbi:RNA recognition motif domain [Trinorchestia longiramus]|nr:RNA recognition motif domain [Trinorchestia longiramus]
MATMDRYNKHGDSKDWRDNYHSNDGGRHNNNKDGGKYDDPPHSRLFIVCGRSLTEDDFRESFGKYGTIEDFWMVKDRNTDEPKGVAYIKFAKTSEAALAMEEMNGQTIGNHLRPLKVLIAHSRDQGSRRDLNEGERLVRLFVVVPKTMTEGELREHFAQFGSIEYASIVKDRNTKESKGFGYVKYEKMSEAAKAYENCDRTFKPVFAEPRPQNKDNYNSNDFGGRGSGVGGGGGGGGGSGMDLRSDIRMDMFRPPGDTYGGGVTRLTVFASPSLNQDQLWKLFDLIPGLDYCDLRKDRKSSGGQGRGVATVVYNNSQSANYACEKLHGFEYPPGQRLIVKPDSRGADMQRGGGGGPPAPMMGNHPMGPPRNSPLAGPPVPLAPHNGSMGAAGAHVRSGQNLQQDLAAQLAETIAQASSLIQAAGLAQSEFAQSTAAAGGMMMGAGSSGVGMVGGGMASHGPSSHSDTYDPSYCSIKLPPPQPLAPVDSPVAERLFIVCQGSTPPSYAMKDVFGRFGNLIDIYMLNGKNFGYAKYACKEAASKAITTMHGQEVMGARLKVMEADPHEKNDGNRKRIRMDE